MTAFELFGVGLDRWLTFTIAEAAVSLSPGPAVALVVGYGMSRGARLSVFASMGILSANFLYFALSAAGLGAVLVATPWLFALLKWGGIAWLVWLGLAALLGHASPLQVVAADAGAHPGRARLRAWTSGLVLQLANPKVMLSFLAVLPPFVDASAPVAPQMLVFAASSVIPEFVILAGYGWFGARAAPLLARPGYARATERVAGVLLLVAALTMTWISV